MGHLVINMLDDFHVIQTITVPGEILTLSSATHMATSLLDVQTQVPCIARPPDDTAIHWLSATDDSKRVTSFLWLLRSSIYYAIGSCKQM